MRPLGFLSHRPTGPIVAVLLLAGSLGRPAGAWPADDPEHRAALKGIKAVQVAVVQPKADAAQDGLTSSDLQLELESRLRQGGVPVGPASPEAILRVELNTNKAANLYAVNVLVEVVQRVNLARTPAVLLTAPTWSLAAVGLVDAAHLREVRSVVATLADRFITAYLEQNPRQ